MNSNTKYALVASTKFTDKSKTNVSLINHKVYEVKKSVSPK